MLPSRVRQRANPRNGPRFRAGPIAGAHTNLALLVIAAQSLVKADEARNFDLLPAPFTRLWWLRALVQRLGLDGGRCGSRRGSDVVTAVGIHGGVKVDQGSLGRW